MPGMPTSPIGVHGPSSSRNSAAAIPKSGSTAFQQGWMIQPSALCPQNPPTNGVRSSVIVPLPALSHVPDPSSYCTYTVFSPSSPDPPVDTSVRFHSRVACQGCGGLQLVPSPERRTSPELSLGKGRATETSGSF